MFRYIAVEVKAWLSHYILLFYMDAIGNPCAEPDAGLTDLLVTKHTLHPPHPTHNQTVNNMGI